MRKYIILLITIILVFALIGCNQSENLTSSTDNVIINLPKDNTVNGYRLENYSSNTDNMPDYIKSEDVGISNSPDDNFSGEFCGNKNSKIFHKKSCDSVSKMKNENKYYASREELLNNGYKSCSKCNP